MVLYVKKQYLMQQYIRNPFIILDFLENALKNSFNEIIAVILIKISITYLFPITRIQIINGKPITVVKTLFTSTFISFPSI